MHVHSAAVAEKHIFTQTHNIRNTRSQAHTHARTHARTHTHTQTTQTTTTTTTTTTTKTTKTTTTTTKTTATYSSTVVSDSWPRNRFMTVVSGAHTGRLPATNQCVSTVTCQWRQFPPPAPPPPPRRPHRPSHDVSSVSTVTARVTPSSHPHTP